MYMDGTGGPELCVCRMCHVYKNNIIFAAATGVPVSSVPPAPGSSNTYISGKSKTDMVFLHYTYYYVRIKEAISTEI